MAGCYQALNLRWYFHIGTGRGRVHFLIPHYGDTNVQ